MVALTKGPYQGHDDELRSEPDERADGFLQDGHDQLQVQGAAHADGVYDDHHGEDDGEDLVQDPVGGDDSQVQVAQQELFARYDALLIAVLSKHLWCA